LVTFDDVGYLDKEIRQGESTSDEETTSASVEESIYNVVKFGNVNNE
jgi:hypothetical protein